MDSEIKGINSPTPLFDAGGTPKPTDGQRRWLERGLSQAGGKLPLFDEHGQKVSQRTIESCLKQSWVEPWFENPIKKDWIVCKLTDAGRAALK